MFFQTYPHVFLLQVYDYDGNLTLRIDSTSIGKYICRASVKGYLEISATAQVFMKGIVAKYF